MLVYIKNYVYFAWDKKLDYSNDYSEKKDTTSTSQSKYEMRGWALLRIAETKRQRFLNESQEPSKDNQ